MCSSSAFMSKKYPVRSTEWNTFSVNIPNMPKNGVLRKDTFSQFYFSIKGLSFWGVFTTSVRCQKSEKKVFVLFLKGVITIIIQFWKPIIYIF